MEKIKRTKIITAEPLQGMTPDQVLKNASGADRYLYDLDDEVSLRRAGMIMSLYNIPAVVAGVWRA